VASTSYFSIAGRIKNYDRKVLKRSEREEGRWVVCRGSRTSYVLMGEGSRIPESTLGERGFGSSSVEILWKFISRRNYKKNWKFEGLPGPVVRHPRTL
jgi:hypothetical protein